MSNKNYTAAEKLEAEKLAAEYEALVGAALLVFFVNFDNYDDDAVKVYKETTCTIVNQCYNYCASNGIVSGLATLWLRDAIVQHNDIVNEYVKGTVAEREVTRTAVVKANRQ